MLASMTAHAFPSVAQYVDFGMKVYSESFLMAIEVKPNSNSDNTMLSNETVNKMSVNKMLFISLLLSSSVQRMGLMAGASFPLIF